MARVADYLAFRARALPAGARRGAGPQPLLEMMVQNARERLGARAAAALARFERALPALERAAHPVEVDARLHRWEWLALPDGRLLKTDAVDHCAGHDLVGCQDIGWDLAGAAVELALTPAGAVLVERCVARTAGASLPPAARAFYRAAYLAFQLVLPTVEASRLPPGDTAAAEASRLDRAAARYARLLAAAARAVPFSSAAPSGSPSSAPA